MTANKSFKYVPPASWLHMKDPRVKEIRVDPHPDNLRAIGCYAKVGFKKIGAITTPDGPAIMMTLKRKLSIENNVR